MRAFWGIKEAPLREAFVAFVEELSKRQAQ